MFRYPEAFPFNKKTMLNGVGKAPIMDVPIWVIPQFVIKDDNGKELVYEKLLIAVIKLKRFSFDMIIPLTMLNRTAFSFDYAYSADNALFKIRSVKDKFFTRPIYAKTDKDYINMIQVFTQD